ncbi:unnamed protein product [Gordionus sp. m RMFG-2023]|uniref:uncharacterized protein LOC135929522 n=1 Tax=Gordionus sp. m RMFG-2023 TaxID=3053472 RepID=UPI0030E07E96
MLAESEFLVKQLSQQDKGYDQLINKAMTIKNKIKTMKDFNKDLKELSKINLSPESNNYHKRIILESLYITKLKKENLSLKGNVEEHKAMLELIMKKYRNQMIKLMEINQINHVNYDPIQHCKKVDTLALKVEEMARIMCKAIALDTTTYSKEKSTQDDSILERKDEHSDNYFSLCQKIKLLNQENQDLRKILRSFPLISKVINKH